MASGVEGEVSHTREAAAKQGWELRDQVLSRGSKEGAFEGEFVLFI